MCNSNYETTLRFIVNSVWVYSKLNDFFENGKDNWCFCNFPILLYYYDQRFSEPLVSYHFPLATLGTLVPVSYPCTGLSDEPGHLSPTKK